MNREKSVPAVRSGIREITPAGIAGIVDEDVESVAAVPFGESVIQLLEQCRDGFRIGKVRVKGEGAATGFFDSGNHFVGAGLVGVVSQRDRRAFFRKTFSNRAADAPRPSGYQGGFSNKQL
ncbi:hypothetical protein D3C85_890810 [compost metagenome]